MMLNAEAALALADDAATLALLHDRELSAPLLAELEAVGFPDNLGLLPAGDASRNVFELMRIAVSSWPAAPDSRYLDNLAADFAAIYLTGAYGVSPSQSFWLSDDHLLCQDAMFDLRALYAASGLKAPDWRKRPDDHLVFQLQFLARRLVATMTEDDWRQLAGFLDRHLLRWLPDFAARVAQRCDTLFYGALATLTNSWCQQLRDLLAEQLGEARPSAEETEAMRRPQRDAEVMEVAEVTKVTAAPLHFVPGGAGPSW